MLTRIFNKTTTPTQGRPPVPRRSGRVVSGKKELSGEACGLEAVDFREAMHQVMASAGDSPLKPAPDVPAETGTVPEEEATASSEADAMTLPSPTKPPDERDPGAAGESGDARSPAATSVGEPSLEIPEAPTSLLRSSIQISDDPPAGEDTANPAEAMARMAEEARLIRRGETREIEILLRPESLGRLRVRVASDGRGVSVRILAEEASAAESLAANGAHLKADLDAAGIDLADFEISVSADDEDFRSPDRSEAVLRQHVLPAPAGKGPPDRGRIDYFA